MKPSIQIIGFFIFILANTFSCKKTTNPDAQPVISLSASNPYTTYMDSVVSFSPVVTPANSNYTYSWSVDGTSVSTNLHFDYSPQQIGEHILNFDVKNTAGQTTTSSIKIVVLKSERFKVLGYLPSYKSPNPVTIRWNALTHLCYAFVGVNTNGSLNDAEINVLIHSIVHEGHAKGVAVLGTVGGGGTTNFSTCLLNQAARTTLADNLVAFLKTNELDGLDIDFEEFEGSSTGASDQDLVKRTALENLYKDLRMKLPSDKLLTAAVSPSWQNPNWGYYNCYTNTMHQYLNFVGLMIYDQTGTYSSSPYGQHADFEEHFIPSINHWINNRHLPPSKLLAGVPFYGYQFNSTNGGLANAIAYRDIITQYPNDAVESEDHVGLTFYNGQPTILEKSNYIKDNQYGGIMIWELTQDTDDLSKSLLSTIQGVFSPN